MRTHYIPYLAVAMLMASPASFGQNLNPTVEVTNAYQGKPSDVHKPGVGMTVPDSLLQFDLDFNYEVFDSPYGGSYSFKPYMLDMHPHKDAYRGKSLYLKTGAGYTLHPELVFVYSPEPSGRFQFSVHVDHRSFIGNYHKFAPVYDDKPGRLIFKKTGGLYKGNDLLTTAGLDGRVNWDNAVLSFGVGYDGLATKDTLTKHAYNAADFNLRVRSRGQQGTYFFYDAGIKGRFANDNLDTEALPLPALQPAVGKQRLNESYFVLDGEIGPVLDGAHRILVGFEGSTYSYGGLFKGSFGRIAAMPHYQFRKGAFDLILGLRVEGLVRGDQKDSAGFPAIAQKHGKTVYPDVHAALEVAPEHLLLYADVTGGSHLNPYASLIAANHHLTPYFSRAVSPLIDNGIERVNARIGIKGNIASRLLYDLRAGGAVYENGLLDALTAVSGNRYLPAVTYADYNLLFADLLLGWKSKGVSLEGAFHYRKTNLEQVSSCEDLFAHRSAVPLMLPAFSGHFGASYYLNPRTWLGLALEWGTFRDGKCTLDAGPELSGRIPGWLDPGVQGGWWITRKFEIWAKAGNLLGTAIQRNPLYAEGGPWFTAGIALNL